MADIRKAMPNILKWEGGYSNDKDDSGGCTMKGVTISVYRKYYGKEKTCNDLRMITDDQWLTIFRNGYWNKVQGDRIENQSIANLCVDMCWGSGPVTAIKKIQRCLGCKSIDGIVGTETLGKLNNGNRRETFEKLWNMRKLWLCNIAQVGNNGKFLKGWLNRLNTYTFE